MGKKAVWESRPSANGGRSSAQTLGQDAQAPKKMQQIKIQPDFDSWRNAARTFLAQQIPPTEAVFIEAGLDHATLPNLFNGTTPEPQNTPHAKVPVDFVTLAKTVACHTDPAQLVAALPSPLASHT